MTTKVAEEKEQSFKKTEAGPIPQDWDIISFDDAFDFLRTASFSREQLGTTGEIQCIHYGDIHTKWSFFIDMTNARIPTVDRGQAGNYTQIKEGDLVIADASEDYEGVAKSVEVINLGHTKAIAGLHTFLLRDKDSNFVDGFKGYITSSPLVKSSLDRYATGLKVFGISKNNLKLVLIPKPPSEQQNAIVQALRDTDALIDTLEKLIAKKRAIKQGAMQELLTGKRRLPGFNGKWGVNTIKEVTDCLDNLRVPLNESQRAVMQGDVPYCGANGILDYINDYVVDDDIILIAEDGGYFDEFEHRPIAYRMIGKCWVNNHAHILKAKGDYEQGFIYYSLVHKNILRFLASGTRAKLNKSEMYKIEIDTPPSKAEQAAITVVLDDLSDEIAGYERELAKYRLLKLGMMQALLTGKIRLLSK